MKNRNKISALSLALFALILTGCGPKEIIESTVDPSEVTNIILDRHYASLFYNDKVGFTFNEEVQLSPTVLPRRKGDRNLKWSSSNPEVATVDSSGLVKAISEGTSEITVTNYDGTISASSHIVVNNMNESKLSYCNTRLDDIVARQNKSTFEMPDVITSYETFTQTIEKNGVLDTKTYFTQNITTSKDNAYIRLDINQIEWKVNGGSPELSQFEYIFYTTDQYESYLFKTSGLTKNYMSVNQSDYIGKGKLTALKAICNNFFTSGETIIEENYENILMQEAQTNNWIVSNDKNEHYARMANVPGQLAFDIRESLTYTAYSDDEKDLNIPVGTAYKLDVYDRVLFENFLVTGKYIEQSATYTIGSDSYVNKMVVDTYYRTNDEIIWPNKDMFSKVDSIFNL